ncbi:hypothetical protein BmHG_00315 [Borrelia miyamotoi]|uniref:Uncharacterized protein n=1 Tax=Borrelia miyamotoi TaxID=47466 RepID=A0AAP9CG66_9SPIR|nr:hypothetical protein [Borrelia miyamotoi]AHH05105.1 Hypothetical protein BOM_0562 [Borrelia miyamotoi FR64b]ATQ14898.1 hypothetical protein CNO14_02725 [Borrelia miyamotoi]ATQ16081.1 hypothetical protein CNO13_02725 [Borrelia miyamotoi]ATQ17226.1 hypothetical protein CNO12_02730 [Borrelia miyamotoi]ATQ18268.1 hypothetical protein CNO11_01520 [Borrelia miyamotoi]
MMIAFLFLFSCSNLYSFLEFGKGEKFDLVGDFGELKDGVLDIGIRLRAWDTHFSVFSNNYKIVYSRNKMSKYDRSILIVFDKDLGLNLEFFGDFIYKDEKVFLKDDSKVFDVVVFDQYSGQIVNPLFVIKNRNNLNSSFSFYLGDIFLKGKGNTRFELKGDLNLELELGNYSLVLNFLKNNVRASKALNGIYYFEVFLNNNSIFRADFQSIFLDNNSYVISGDRDCELDVFNIKRDNGNIEINNLKFTSGRNEIKIKYGDVYDSNNSLIYRFTLNG